MLKTAPNPVDVQDLQFKLKCRLKVFNKAENDNFSQHCGLVTCASRFGLIFVGTNTSSFQVIQLKHLEEYTKSDGDKSDYPRRNITLPSPPKYLSTNCEHTILAVVIEKDGCPCALFYDVKSFYQQNIVQLQELRLSPTPGVYVVDINWNPALASIFTACKSDGTLGVYELKSPGIDINELPAASGATCFCWSPKGKQIAVGSRDGKITQYKPDLKAVKVINAPPLKEPHSLISLQWVSNYQFIGVFHPIGPNNQSTLLVIDAPKTGDSTFMNYDDICYSNGNTRASQFYMILQHNWNILMVASSNSMEVGILGNSGECWTQWTMGDAARAELPLSSDHQETLPIGLALDIGSTKPVPWGESVLPPAPILLLFSHYGTLCCFNIINLKEGIPTICTPPDQLTDTSGLQYFINKIESGPVKEAAQVQSPSLLKTTQPQHTKNPSLFGNVNSPLQTDLSKPQGLNFSTTQPGSLFQVQAASTPVTQVNKSNTSLFSSTTYQPMYPSLQNTESKFTSNNVISQVTSTNSPFTSKAVVTIPPSVHLNIPKPNQSIPIKTSEELNKTDIMANDSLKVEEEAEALFAQMVKEECIFLESELKAILHQGKSLKLNLGTSDDKTRIVQTTKSLEDFFKEVVETCKVQNAEVHILKQNLLQSWAWYEEVKSLHMASKDESMSVILRAQPLDSVSEKQLEDIRHANYYLESQIAQAHRALDEQWENFQDYCKKTYKMKIPTMEVIFQTMVKQNAILAKQNFILKDIASRIKSKSRSSIGPSLLLSMNNIEDLPDELKKLRMNPEDICQIQYEHAENRRKNLTKTKVDNLKSFLTKRKPPRISVIKPQFSTSVIQPSPAKLKQLSKSEVRAPLIAKENAVRKIDFVQSTPKPSVVKSEPLEEASTTTPIEGLQNFALKFEAKNFNKVPEKSFTPFSKNVISGSPNSAFVSTSFAGMSSTSTPVSATFKPVSFGHGSTNVSTVGKTLPSFVVVTTVPSSNQPVITISAGNVPKAFSFANASGGSLPLPNSTKNTPASLANTTNTNAVSSSGAKPPFAFYLQTTAKTSTPATTTSKKPIFVVTTVKSSTPATSAFTLATPPKSTIAVSDNSNTAPAKQNYIFGTQAATSSSASFSLSKSNTTNIFKYTNQKSADSPTASVATSKPFIFSSVAAATKTTISSTNVVATTPSTATATITPIPNHVVASNVSTSSAQPVSFAVSTPNVDLPKPVSNVQQLAPSTTPSVTITPVTSVTPVSTQSSIFGTPTSTKPSLFGTFTSPTTTQTSIFGSSVTTTSTQSSIFPVGVNKPSIFGTPPSQLVSSTPTVTTSVATTTTSTGTIPTGVITATSTVPTAATTSSVTSTAVSSATMGVAFDTQPSTTQQPPQSPTFAPVSSTTGFTFGVAPSTKPSIFGSGNGVSTTKPPLFGTIPASTTSSSIFGVVTTTTSQSFDSNATPAPIFGTVTTTASAQSSIFGAAPATTTTQSQGFGLFGSTAQKSSIFGSTPPTTQSSIFGSTSQPTLFGATTTTTSNSTFGQNQSLFNPPKSTPSIFGQSSVFSSSSNTFGSPSVFGNSPTTFGQSTGSIFGNPPATTSGGIFGGGTPTTSSVFGSSAPVFGSPVSTASSPFGSGSVFSPTSSSSTGTFGFGTLNVGSTATTSNTGFGVTPTSNPFGSENKSIFGTPAATSTSSVFGSTNTGSIFGNTSQTFGSGFGGQPVFGQQTTFGQSTFGSNTFGQQTSGPFSAGSGSVAQSGFGAGPSFQKPSGFGSSPVFGSGPAFGSAPSFGGAPAFGSPPTFSSPSKIFGAGSPTFGATGAAQNTAFGNLANQATVGFGNLAQQASNTTPNAPFSGSSSFSSWR